MPQSDISSIKVKDLFLGTYTWFGNFIRYAIEFIQIQQYSLDFQWGNVMKVSKA
jgi:hypothetical protein